jgi:predicted RNA binding protein YcfA (HicA-like mRNA interferase family)
VRLPRDVTGRELARALSRYGYQVVRQSGSHIRLTTLQQGEHSITIPDHHPLRVGTLSGVISDVARHLGVDSAIVRRELFD